MTETGKDSSFYAGYLQFDVRIGDTGGNFSRVREGFAAIAGSGSRISPGIIALPELWSAGYAYESLEELAQKTPELLEKLQGLSAEHNIIIAGSLPEYTDNSYYNTLYITGPEGVAGSYRKQRLFNPMKEDSFFSAGPAASPILTDLGPVASLVCYDLRFPELAREQAAMGCDLLVISAQWPKARINHWRTLVQARAIENQMFILAANRCGTTGDTAFGGHSMIVAPDGTILLEAGEGEEFRGVVMDRGMVAASRSLFSTVPTR